jgi:hypothetical protein
MAVAASFASVVSVLALCVSAVTAYLTLFRRGTIKMTQPTVIFFGPDGGPSENGSATNKIFLRTLLFATAKRGRIVESMYARLSLGETRQNFNIWIYGDGSLARGSGLFVGENGVACNHHFLLPNDGAAFEFRAGSYVLEVFAKIAGTDRQLMLHSIRLNLSDRLAAELRNPRAGVYLDWGPDSQQYHAHIDLKREPTLPPALLESLTALRSPGSTVAATSKKSAEGRKGQK